MPSIKKGKKRIYVQIDNEKRKKFIELVLKTKKTIKQVIFSSL